VAPKGHFLPSNFAFRRFLEVLGALPARPRRKIHWFRPARILAEARIRAAQVQTQAQADAIRCVEEVERTKAWKGPRMRGRFN